MVESNLQDNAKHFRKFINSKSHNFSKSFDKVNHSILLHKLAAYVVEVV